MEWLFILFAFNSNKIGDFIGFLFKVIAYNYNVCPRLKSGYHGLGCANAASYDQWHREVLADSVYNVG